jgi:hypothetical protein
MFMNTLTWTLILIFNHTDMNFRFNLMRTIDTYNWGLTEWEDNGKIDISAIN